MAIDASQSIQSTSHEQTPSADAETLVYTYYDVVYRLALSILNDAAEAQDATQETFISAAESLSEFRGEAQLKTWLLAIAVNECRDTLRRRQRRQRLKSAMHKVQSLLSHTASPEDEAARNEDEERLYRAVSSLSQKQRLPILLRYVHNLSGPQIASVLGISEGTVYSRLYYARRRLRRLMR
jgi:RNA polymerase sigma-70 factor (ECF subfamily)